jgi:hypothetical protein
VVVRAMVFVFILALPACSSPPIVPDPQAPTSAPSPTKTRQSASQPSASTAAQWQEPTAYSFTVESRCGEGNLLGRFDVQVEDGDVVSVEPLDETASAAIAYVEPEEVPTLAEMLDRVAEARLEGASEVSLSTDPADGHPVSVAIDWQAIAIDDEECYAISEYIPAGD